MRYFIVDTGEKNETTPASACRPIKVGGKLLRRYCVYEETLVGAEMMRVNNHQVSSRQTHIASKTITVKRPALSCFMASRFILYVNEMRLHLFFSRLVKKAHTRPR
jgi:hypothetical protein